MNIYDISQAAGVSIATVSRVLNQSPRVSSATRAKVLAVMDDLGYTPNAFARGLGLNSMRVIGLLCAELSDAYIAQAVSRLEHALRAQGYSCLLACAGSDGASFRSTAEMLLAQRVDGMLLVGSGFATENAADDAFIRDLARRVPVVMLGAALEGEGLYAVLCDDRAATRDAVRRLIASGRRRILYLYHAATYGGRRKLAGYKDALSEAGLPEDDALIRLIPGATDDPLPDVPALLRRPDMAALSYDAVMTSDDKLAVGVLRFALESGIRVPQDLSVIGYNDSVLARCTVPALTSVDSKLPALCDRCVETLMGLLSARPMPKKAVFSGETVERGTTGDGGNDEAGGRLSEKASPCTP